MACLTSRESLPVARSLFEVLNGGLRHRRRPWHFQSILRGLRTPRELSFHTLAYPMLIRTTTAPLRMSDPQPGGLAASVA